jgi:L,D-peptidoglycan transpeptidase YkuD (ErfK/YbiS/YcfS/YnhG family)
VCAAWLLRAAGLPVGPVVRLLWTGQHHGTDGEETAMTVRRLALTGVVVLALLAPVTTSTASTAATVTGVSTIARSAPTARAATTTTAPTVLAPRIPGVGRWRVGVSVRQVIVVSATTWRTTYGTVSLYSRTATGWHLSARWPARLGYSGLVVAAKRVQDTGKTPAGVFRITQAFGRQASPGTRLPYTKVTMDHWWVEDRRSAYYNQMRLGSRGGFARRTTGYNSSERLATMGAQYDYAAVIDFNRPNPVIGRGAGIFLHAFGSGATGGCVSIRRDRMAATLRWLNPAANPRILIGEDNWLAGA